MVISEDERSGAEGMSDCQLHQNFSCEGDPTNKLRLLKKGSSVACYGLVFYFNGTCNEC